MSAVKCVPWSESIANGKPHLGMTSEINLSTTVLAFSFLVGNTSGHLVNTSTITNAYFGWTLDICTKSICHCENGPDGHGLCALVRFVFGLCLRHFWHVANTFSRMEFASG